MEKGVLYVVLFIEFLFGCSHPSPKNDVIYTSLGYFYIKRSIFMAKCCPTRCRMLPDSRRAWFAGLTYKKLKETCGLFQRVGVCKIRFNRFLVISARISEYKCGQIDWKCRISFASIFIWSVYNPPEFWVLDQSLATGFS